MTVVSLTEQVRFIEGVFGSGRISRNSRNFDVKCPICDPTDPNKKKLSILLPDGRNHCWVCGYRSRSLASLIWKYGTRAQVVEYRDRFMPDVQRSSRCLWIDADDVPRQLSLPDDFKLLATSTSRHPNVRAIRNYLAARNVSERDLWRYKLGYSESALWTRRVIMPSFNAAGELNLFVGRAIDKRRKPKYEMPDGDRRHVVFNELNVDWTRRLVLCEGPFDLMKCGDNAVPLLGGDLNKEGALFQAIVSHRTPIALAMDMDMKATKMPRVAAQLHAYDVDVSIVTVNDDPGSMTKKEFRAALEAARPFEWQQAFLDRLEAASKVSL